MLSTTHVTLWYHAILVVIAHWNRNIPLNISFITCDQWGSVQDSNTLAGSVVLEIQTESNNILTGPMNETCSKINFYSFYIRYIYYGYTYIHNNWTSKMQYCLLTFFFSFLANYMYFRSSKTVQPCISSLWNVGLTWHTSTNPTCYTYINS